MIRGAQQKLRKRRNKTGITECFRSIQLHRVEVYDSLQENILDTILSLSKLYFRRYNEYNNKYLDIYINK